MGAIVKLGSRMRSVWLVSFCVAMLSSSTAAADPRAGAAFDAGREALARGDLAAACDLFRESYRLEPAPGAILNLGECEARRGRVASAWQAFHDASLTLAPGDFRLSYAQERAHALAPRVPHARVVLEGGALRGRVTVDGVELGAASIGIELPLDPGPHAARARSADGADRVSSFVLKEGERRDVVLDLRVEARGPGAPSERSPASASSAWSIGSIALGGVGLAAGSVTGLLAIDAHHVHREHCDASGCDDEGIDAAHRGRPLALVSTVGFAVGVAALGVGLYLLLAQRRHESSPARPR